MAESAVDKIAAKLEKQKAKRAVAVAEPEAVEESDLDEEETQESDVEADDSDDTEEDEEEVEPPTKSLAERAAARRASKAPAATTKSKAEVKPAAAKGKAAPSAKQIAAREAFAARSRERAAAAKGETVEATPVQSPAEVRAAQKAKREAERAAAAKNGSNKPTATGTGKAKVVQPAKAVVSEKKPTAKTKGAKAAPAKTAPVKPAKQSANGDGGTKTKVLALWAKGYTRQQIMEQLGLSYASVFYHTRGVEGTGNNAGGARGRIFVNTPLNADGVKIGRGKTEEVSRSEAMRRSYLSGKSVSEIKDEFEVRYQIAYTAVRSLMGEAAADEIE